MLSLFSELIEKLQFVSVPHIEKSLPVASGCGSKPNIISLPSENVVPELNSTPNPIGVRSKISYHPSHAPPHPQFTSTLPSVFMPSKTNAWPSFVFVDPPYRIGRLFLISL